MIAEFLKKETNQTLKQALEEYYKLNPNLYNPFEMDPRSSKTFIAHDAAHIVFGCDTDIQGECKVGAWTLFGSNLGLWGYTFGFQRAKEIRQATLGAIFELGVFKSLRIFLSSLPVRFKIWLNSFKMTKKWDFYGYENQLESRVVDIRKEFGIEIL